MQPQPTAPIVVGREDRFERLRAIRWWDQERLAAARVLVVGAGALGNEVIKNLSLLGIGCVAVADFDRVEISNLTRAVLFRPEDTGQPKAKVACARGQELSPTTRFFPLVANASCDVGLGWFRWADAVVGAVDNREARVFINAACTRLDRPWFDGGIDVLGGIVRGFHAPATSCYECTMSELDWKIVAQRRSCALLGRQAALAHGQPTTPTSASVIAAIQVQELVKHLHGLDALLGRGFVFEGSLHASYTVNFPIEPTCPRHDPISPIEDATELSSLSTVAEVWAWAETRLGPIDALDLDREIVESLDCASCGQRRRVLVAIDRLAERDASCPACGELSSPRLLHTIGRDSPLWSTTLTDLGIPMWDVLWARAGERMLGIAIEGDRPTRRFLAEQEQA